MEAVVAGNRGVPNVLKEAETVGSVTGGSVATTGNGHSPTRLMQSAVPQILTALELMHAPKFHTQPTSDTQLEQEA
jgi:hypothetical protein